MSYQSLFTSAQTVSTAGNIVVPSSYQGPTHFIIPEQIVNFCIDRYDLANDQIRVLDPMCGIGTIPRIINEKGGSCIGIEIDEKRYNAALENVNKSTLHLGSYLEIDLPENNFQCIFTSMPFDWFKETNQVDSIYADTFKKLLTPDGFILLDSLPSVNREGQEWSVASRQCDYLETNGFLLVEIVKFINDNHVDSTNESVIMKFQAINCAALSG